MESVQQSVPRHRVVPLECSAADSEVPVEPHMSKATADRSTHLASAHTTTLDLRTVCPPKKQDGSTAPTILTWSTAVACVNESARVSDQQCLISQIETEAVAVRAEPRLLDHALVAGDVHLEAVDELIRAAYDRSPAGADFTDPMIAVAASRSSTGVMYAFDLIDEQPTAAAVRPEADT